MATSSVNNDVLASILAELRDLKVSHQALEARLSSVDNTSSNTNNNNNAAQGLARPISISSNGHPAPHLTGSSSPQLGASAGGGAASPTLQFGSPNSPLPTGGLSALQQQYGGSGNSINTLSSTLGNRKSSTNESSSIKQDFINWARNTPPLKERDSNSTISEKQIYTSRAVLTSELTYQPIRLLLPESLIALAFM